MWGPVRTSSQRGSFHEACIMHRKSVFSHEWRILLLAIIVGSYNQGAFAGSCPKANKSVSILKGQNLSVKFHLKHPLLENQSLTWRKMGITWKFSCTNYFDNLRCSGIHNTRYNLTRGTRNETIVHLVIEQTEENDMGDHIIQLLSGSRPICTPLSLNVTVLDTDPPCLMILQNNSQEMQMSCLWVEDTSGENANIFFKNEVIKKYELTSKRTVYDRVSNLTKNLSVFLDMEEVLHAENHESSKCVLSDRNASVEKTCQFPSVQKKTISDDPTSLVEFACCTSKVETSLHWWYVHHGGYKLLPFPEESPLMYAGDDYIGLLCGEMKAHDSLMLHGLGTLNFEEQIENNCFNITLAVEEVNTTDSKCTKLVVNVSVLTLSSTSISFSAPTISLKRTQSASTTKNCDTSSKDMLTIEIASVSASSDRGRHTQDASILISVATISAIALIFSVASFFVKCTFFHGERSRDENLLNSHAARHDGNTENVQTIGLNFSSSQNLVQLGSEDTWVRRDTSNQSSVDMVESDGHGPEHVASSSSGRPLELHSRSVRVKQHTRHEIQEQLEETAPHVEKCEELHRGIPTASCMETAYESMDDVEDTYMVHSPPTQTSSACFHSSLEELGICHEGKRKKSTDVRKMPSFLVKPNIQGEDTEEGIFLGSLNIDALYAKPDLSRKRGKSSSQLSVSRPVKPTTRGDHKPASSVMEGTDIETLYAKTDMNRKTKRSVYRSVSPQSGRAEMIPAQDLSHDDVWNPGDSVAGSGTAKTARKSEHIYENCK